MRWLMNIEYTSGREPMRVDPYLLVFLLIVVALLLAGCDQTFVKPEPVPENCDATCRTPCDTRIPRWNPPDPDAANAWDTYPAQVTIPLQAKAKACDLHRRSCVQCLDRLKKAGVTR